MFELMGRGLLIEHRHDDGTWAQLETVGPSQHDAAEHDAEREWLKGRVYQCTRCEEQVRVTYEPDRDQPS
jgi:hypothetical protein